MTTGRGHDYLVGLVRELCKLPRETEWVEFKVSQSDPQAIGEYISALANAAALNGKAFAYLVWGVEDGTTCAVERRIEINDQKPGRRIGRLKPCPCQL